MCYAEWWRRDYNGGIPSREDVAVGLGLPHYCWEQLYKAARHGLKSHGFAFIHSLKGNEYFRTLLNQGGLPVNYIKNGTNLSGFSRFLIGLVEELSSINIDWDDNNIDLIKNFNCIAILGKHSKMTIFTMFHYRSLMQSYPKKTAGYHMMIRIPLCRN